MASFAIATSVLNLGATVTALSNGVAELTKLVMTNSQAASGSVPANLTATTSGAATAQTPMIAGVTGQNIFVNTIDISSATNALITLSVSDGTTVNNLGTLTTTVAPTLLQINETFASGATVMFGVGAAAAGTTTISVSGSAILNGILAYIQVFDLAPANVTLGTTVPALSFAVPAASTVTYDSTSHPTVFYDRCSVASTTTPAGSIGSASGILINALIN